MEKNGATQAQLALQILAEFQVVTGDFGFCAKGKQRSVIKEGILDDEEND